MNRFGRLGLRFALLLTSIVIATALAEVALRMWYRDEGRRTLGGPGGRQFEHDTIDGELRGRRDVGPKAAGVPRLMVVGDSITYGQGVRDWRDTWPELLARSLESSGRKHELAVFATPGDDMPQHLKKLRDWGHRVRPDLFIYQWYVNDVEAISHRPDATRAWHRWAWHRPLLRSSYLYYIADHRLSQLLPPPQRSYVDYLLTDFAPGSMEWAEFERQFHEFAVRVRQLAPRRIMALYPQVPFQGTYPLQPIHDRMRALAEPHTLDMPPTAWTRSGGAVTQDDRAPWKQVYEVAAQNPAGIIETREYVFPSGTLTLQLLIRASSAGLTNEPVATLQLIDAATNHTISRTSVRVPAPADTLGEVPLSVTLPGDGLHRLRVRIQSAGGSGWALAAVRVPVDYGFEVVDLSQPLNSLQTHASAFDAHPNEAAHRVIADEIYAAIVGKPTP